MDEVSTLDITTLFVAILGLVAAAVSLVWQIISLRLTGPVVRVELGFGFQVMGGNVGENILYVRAINIGRAPVEVNGWGYRLPDGKTIIDTDPEPGSGPPLPITLAGGHEQDWHMRLSRLVGSRESEGYPPIPVRGMVRLAGKEVLSKNSHTV